MVLPLEGRMLEEKFRLVRRLGKGGMASVWLATNTRVDREVAIKLIRPEVLRNEELVGRFRSEAKAAGRIAHPNVCDILDFGIGPVGPYIVMEYLRGLTLSQMIKRGGPMPVPTAVRIVRQALAGLIAAHHHGIIHRDLKPENVFLHETPGGKPVVKIMDFGVAKFTDGTGEITTEQGALLGTPEYMAPEQFLGADMAEPRTDLWAVGAILYRALTGEHAFRGPTVAATLMKVTNDEPPPLRELAPHVPVELEAIVTRCLAKQPSDRFASAKVLRETLLRFEDDEPDDAGTSSLRLLLDRVSAVSDDDEAPAKSSASMRPKHTPLSALPRPTAVLPDPELGGGTPEAKPTAPMIAPGSSTRERSRRHEAVWMRVAPPHRRAPAVIGVLIAGALAAAAWVLLEPEDRDPGASASSMQDGQARGDDGDTKSDEGAEPDPTAGAGPVPSAGAGPDPTAGAGPVPADGAGPVPSAGAGPDPTAGAGPVPAAGAGFVPADGPDPAAGSDPTAEPGPASATGAEPDPSADPESAGADAGAEPTADPESDSASGSPDDADAPAADGVIRFDKYVVASVVGKRSGHTDGRRYCEALALTRHGGVAGWKLPWPSLVKKLAAVPGLPGGRYWTSARWHNKVKVFLLPNGKMFSSSAERKVARTLCVANAPPA